MHWTEEFYAWLCTFDLDDDENQSAVGDDELDDDPNDRVSQAVARFIPENTEMLVSLLREADPLVRRRGLFICEWLFEKSFGALDAALEFVYDPDCWARKALMQVVLNNADRLSPGQAAEVLKLATDPDELIRGNVTAYLGGVDIETIRGAVNMVAEPLRSEFERGFELFEADPSTAQTLFDHALTEVSVESTFALASIQRMARLGQLSSAPQYGGEGYLGESVQRNTARLIRRAMGRHRERRA